MSIVQQSNRFGVALETLAAWVLALMWIAPLAYASALTMVLLAILGLAAAGQFLFLEKRTHYQ